MWDVAAAFCAYIGKEFNKYEMKCVRSEMLMETEDGQFVPLDYEVGI